MASVVDICNLALAHVGDEAQVAAITPPDGTIQSAHCARFYPMVRSALLEMHPWTFAVKRATLAEVDNELPDDWGYAYSLPSTCLRPLSALLPGMPERFFGGEDTDAGSYPYIIEAAEDGSKVLYANVETATLRYIDLITDTTKYTPTFVLCFARLMASYLAGPILKGETGTKVALAQLKLFEVEYAKATTRDANSGKRNIRETYRPAWVGARLHPQISDAQILS